MQKHRVERTVQAKLLVFEMLQCMVDDVHLANNTAVTVAILAQGTSRAVASTQAFLFGRFASCGAHETRGAQQDYSDSFANPKNDVSPVSKTQVPETVQTHVFHMRWQSRGTKT